MADNIVFSSNPGADIRQFIDTKKYSKVAVLVDSNTQKYCYPKIKSSLTAHEVIVVECGEEHKNIETCSIIWQKLTNQQFDRHSVVIILGGGVLGDMGGFCAATYKRGIDFILVPTTLLSQVDSSIGGKLGIDFQNFKNHIGVFQIPALTVLHSGFMESLPENEIRSGFAEIIKHTLISDKKMWDILKTRDLQHQDWETLIKHSVNFKSKVAAEDPKEKGLRKILNAGHTIGHAIESFLLNSGRKVMHGEAIAAGIICENSIAVDYNLLNRKDHEEIKDYILSIFGKLTLHENEDSEIFKLALQDKKNKGDKILCVLLKKIGEAQWDYEINESSVKKALAYYRSL